MALSIDRQAFIDIISQGQGQIGGVLQPPPEGLWGMPLEIDDREDIAGELIGCGPVRRVRLHGGLCGPRVAELCARYLLQGLTNFSTNSSFGCGGSGVFLSLGSLGLRRNFPSSASLKPAASTS
jgi:hypothetical protein